jgi:AcrR family transcriptional regulator
MLTVVPRLRLTRVEQRERTRSAVLAAAAEVFPKRGYHRASVDEIASAAGLTTGAVYSNFDGKAALFLAMYEVEMNRWVADLRAAVSAAATVPDRTEAAVAEWLRYLREQRDWFVLFVEFWAHAVGQPALRERFAAQYARLRVAIAEVIEVSAEEMGIPLPLAADEFGLAVNALGNGLLLDKLLEPDAVPDDLYGRILELVFQGLAPSTPGKRPAAAGRPPRGGARRG